MLTHKAKFYKRVERVSYSFVQRISPTGVYSVSMEKGLMHAQPIKIWEGEIKAFHLEVGDSFVLPETNEIVTVYDRTFHLDGTCEYVTTFEPEIIEDEITKFALIRAQRKLREYEEISKESDIPELLGAQDLKPKNEETSFWKRLFNRVK